MIALTFDADMTKGMLQRLKDGSIKSWFDPNVIEELRRTNTPATIFLSGLWAETYPEVVRSLASDQLFALANHSQDHAFWEMPCFGPPYVTGVDSKKNEVLQAEATITAISGKKPFYFRFPGGCASTQDIRLVTGLGEQPVGWDLSSGDAFQRDPERIVRQVLKGAKGGSIVVMHLMGAPNAPATARALVKLIPLLKSKGFEFVTLPRLLGRT